MPHSAFRRFLADYRKRFSDRNIFAAFLAWQKSLDPSRSHQWWADRWGVSKSMVTLSATGRKSFGRKSATIFLELRRLAGISMEEFYGIPAPVDQRPRASVARKRRRPSRKPH